MHCSRKPASLGMVFLSASVSVCSIVFDTWRQFCKLPVLTNEHVCKLQSALLALGFDNAARKLGADWSTVQKEVLLPVETTARAKAKTNKPKTEKASDRLLANRCWQASNHHHHQHR